MKFTKILGDEILVNISAFADGSFIFVHFLLVHSQFYQIYNE